MLPQPVYTPMLGEAELIGLGSSNDERSIHFSIEHCITAEGKSEGVTTRPAATDTCAGPRATKKPRRC